MQHRIQTGPHHPLLLLIIAIPTRHQHIDNIDQFLMQNVLKLIGSRQCRTVSGMPVERSKVNVRQVRMPRCGMTETVSLEGSLIFVPLRFATVHAFRIARVPWHYGDVSGNDDRSDVVIGGGFQFVGCEELEEGGTGVGEFIGEVLGVLVVATAAGVGRMMMMRVMGGGVRVGGRQSREIWSNGV